MTPEAPAASRAVERYLSRLRDVLPTSQAETVVAEVSALIEDRLEEAGGEHASAEATTKALEALGTPEALASALAGGTIPIDLATRRAFARMLAVVFAGHLLLSIILTAIRADSTLLPGLVGALPRTSWVHTAMGVLGIFLVDVGFLSALFVLIGRERVPAVLQHLRLEMPGSRKDAALALVLVGLLALILNVPSVRDALFAVGSAHDRKSILAPDVVALLPAVDGVLGLFALRHAIILWTGGQRLQGLLVDALASLGGIVLCALVMTRDQLVSIPSSVGLSASQAQVFADLLYRVVILVGFVASLLLATRFVKRLLRIRQVLAR